MTEKARRVPIIKSRSRKSSIPLPKERIRQSPVCRPPISAEATLLEIASRLSAREAAQGLMTVEAEVRAIYGVSKLKDRELEVLTISELSDGNLAGLKTNEKKRGVAVRGIRAQALAEGLFAKNASTKDRLIDEMVLSVAGAAEQLMASVAWTDLSYFAYRTEKALRAPLKKDHKALTLAELEQARKDEAARSPKQVEAFEKALAAGFVSDSSYGQLAVAVKARKEAIVFFRGTFQNVFPDFAPPTDEVSDGLSEYLIRGDAAMRHYAGLDKQAIGNELGTSLSTVGL